LDWIDDWIANWIGWVQVTAGTKYLFRTDIMFHRTRSCMVSQWELSIKNSPAYQRARALLEESTRLEQTGDTRRSTKKYVAALELMSKHRSLPVPRPKKQRKPIAVALADEQAACLLQECLPLELLALIFWCVT